MSRPDLPDAGGGFGLVGTPEDWTVGRFAPLVALPGVRHMVTTKWALDVDLIRHDRPTAGQLAAACLGSAGAAWANQVHGNEVAQPRRPGRAGQADALITDTPGLAVFCVSADCPLILLADRRGRAVGAAHASWRGTVRQVALRTVRAMCEAFALGPDDLIAAICPSAGPCCYEVGPDVRAAAEEALDSADRFFQPRPDAADKWLFDLWAANRAQLRSAGLAGDDIHVAEVCTLCRNDLFSSHRKEGLAAGRFLAAIARSA